MDIFNYEDYKKLVTDWVDRHPSGGRGLFTRIANSLGVGTVLVSQIFRGDRDLAPDQALKLAQFMELTPLETKYFILLVQMARAGTEDFRNYLRPQLEELRAESKQLRHLIPTATELSEEARGIFYSRWIYSSIRLASSIPGVNTVDSIAVRLQLSRTEVSAAVDFLVQNGLCIINAKDEISMGPSWTHLPSDSPYLISRQTGWRLKAIEAMEKKRESDLFFTSPMVLSKEAISKIRQELTDLIKKIKKTAEDSPSEDLACINIDLFRF